MKKTILASLILASNTSFAADHAVLNVEGEIQINGKTVIDHNGRLTTQANNVVNLQDYEQTTGTYSYSFKRGDEACDITETISETSSDYQEICISKVDTYNRENPDYVPGFYPTYEESLACDAVQCSQETIWNEEIQEYEENPNYIPNFYPTYEESLACDAVQCSQETIWVEALDAIRTTSYKDSYINTAVGEDSTWEYTSIIKDNDNNYTFTESEDKGNQSLAITPLSDYNPWYVIGSVISNTNKVTNLDTSETFFNRWESVFTEKLTNVTIDGKNYASCLVPSYSYSNEIDILDLRCEGVGYLMASSDDISIGANQAKSNRLNKSINQIEHRTTRANYDKVKKLRNTKLEQLKNK